MKNQLWAVGFGLGWTVKKKRFGPLMSNFLAPIFKIFIDKKLIYNFSLNIRDAAGFSNPGGLAVMWWA